MSQPEKPKEVTINVDGQEVKVPAGMNIIEAAALAGKEVPHYCYHPKLPVVGNCRMCLVEMGMPMRDRATGEPVLDENGKPKIGWMPKPAIGCGTNASEGMHIKTDSKLVKDCQNGVMEFLLVNHPLDCPICDQAGECRLQEFATDYGRGYSRFVEKKNVKPKRTVLGPRITLDDERCILCTRCIRFLQEVPKDDVLGIVDRGSYSTLTCYPGMKLDNNYSLNTVDICPVGALTSTDFRFKMRVWFLKTTKSICTESSVGVNTTVSSREGKIYRITPRRNDAVNDTWMTDSGRDLYKQVEDKTRLTKYRVNGNNISASEAYIRFSEILPTGKVAYVGSSHMSVEEQYLFKQLIKQQPGDVFWRSHLGENDGILISEDRTPNFRGALLNGLIDDIPGQDFSRLASLIDSGELKNLVVYKEDITKAGLTAAQLKKINLIYIGTHSCETSDVAKLIIPALTVFEKSGTFVNQQFRLQKFEQAVPGPAGVMPDITTLGKVLSLLENTDFKGVSYEEIWSAISKTVPQLANVQFGSIPETGSLLDGSSWSHLQFPETKTLHHDPQGKAKATA